MYMQIRLPLACLVIMLYCLLLFLRKRRLPTKASRVFSCMGYVSIANLCAASVTEYTVNNRALVPDAFNYGWHLVFLVTLALWCALLLIYVLMLIERMGGGSQRNLIIFSCAICVLVIAAQLVLPIEYVDTPQGSYSLGPKAYVLYVMVAYTIILLIVLLVRYRAVLGHINNLVLLASFLVLIAVAIVQMIWPYILITSPGLVMIMIGLMVTMEDARLYISPKTGLYNFLACSTMLQERIAESDEVKLGCYLFFGDESEVVRAMKAVNEQVAYAGSGFMCGTFTDNVLLVLPVPRWRGTTSMPESLPMPSRLDEDVRCEAQVLTLEDVRDVQQVRYALRDLYNRFWSDCLYLDELTHLMRRQAFTMQVNAMIEREEPFALLMIDLDDLKGINDTYGHAMGDKVLRSVAKVFSKVIRSSDIACRMGGDEFAIAISGTTDKDTLHAILERIDQGLERIDDLPAGDMAVSVSVGIRVHDPSEDKVSFADLYAQADEALYKVKRLDKGHFAFYEDEVGH